jgi:mannose-6-phosphate isomerase-like protein (cupin superfamily)
MRLAYMGLVFVALLAPSYSRSVSNSARLTVPDSVRDGLILQAAEGERRVRRPPPSNSAALGSPFIIKVDRQNGGSSNFFMGYEDIPPGRAIPRHYHPHVDEILFVHRGSGVAMLGSREATVTAGATIYIPPGTRVRLKNTGTEPLTIVFLFPKSELGDYFRDVSVAEGQQAVPFTPDEFAALQARHREHITFEPQ